MTSHMSLLNVVIYSDICMHHLMAGSDEVCVCVWRFDFFGFFWCLIVSLEVDQC